MDLHRERGGLREGTEMFFFTTENAESTEL